MQRYVLKTVPLWLTAGLLMCLATPGADAQVSKADDLVYPAMPTVEIPSPQRVQLKNGMTLMLLEDHELPMVEARALIRTGSRWEPADHVGLAGLVGQVLRSGGTESTPSDALDDLLEDRAAVIETFIGTESGGASMSCLRDDFPEMLAVLAEILRRPAFEEDKLAVAKTQVASGIARQNDDANSIAGREFRQLMYGDDSPYARETTYETLANIDRQDLVAWHGKYFHPQNIILGLVGDFKSKEAIALVKDIFGDWPKGPSLNPPEIEIDQPPSGVFHIEKNDVTQSYIRIGHLGIERDNPDYHAIELMNEVFGGSFAARLFSRVRSKKGLAYNVGGRVGSSWDHPGIFSMSMSTKTETTLAGIEALLEEARNMTSEPPSDEEVERARASILNSFVFRADSTGEILNQQMTYAYYGYPLDWMQRYRRGIESTPTAGVREVADKYIHPEKLAILVVGPSTGTDGSLATLGEVQMIDISIPEPPGDVVETTAEGAAEGKRLVADMLTALGGAEKVDAVRTIRLEATMEATSPQGAMQIQSKGFIKLPQQLRYELTLPFGTMVQALSGDGSGFVVTPQGSQAMPASQVAQLEAAILRLPVALLQHRDDPGFEAVALEDGELDGEPIKRLHVSFDGHQQTLGIDAETGHVLSIEYRGTGFTGAPGDLRQVFSDYRQVEGVMMPFASTTTFDGQPMFDGVNTNVEINGDIDDGLFVKPE